MGNLKGENMKLTTKQIDALIYLLKNKQASDLEIEITYTAGSGIVNSSNEKEYFNIVISSKQELKLNE